MTLTIADEPLLEAEEIQGHSVRGFDTAFLTLLGVQFADAAKARPWLASCAERLATLRGVHGYRLRRSGGHAEAAAEVLVNAALSRRGLDALGFDGTAMPGRVFLTFLDGQPPLGSLFRRFACRLQATVRRKTCSGGTAGTPDVLPSPRCWFLLDRVMLDRAVASWSEEAVAAGFTILRRDDGALLEGEREHFGYRDGISQVGVRGRLSADQPLTPRLPLDPSDPLFALYARPGQPLVWPGQFLFGYPAQTEDPLTPGSISGATPWMRNGSLLVYRRLRQDVAAFRAFLGASAVELTRTLGHAITDEQLGARVVGRWQDGTPVQLESPTNPRPPSPVTPCGSPHFCTRRGARNARRRRKGTRRVCVVKRSPRERPGTRGRLLDRPPIRAVSAVLSLVTYARSIRERSARIRAMPRTR